MANNNLYSQTDFESGTIIADGRHIYFEKYGVGDPLIFLHGYGLSSESWKSYVKDFSQDYTVYLIDLPGHGRSDNFQEDLSVKEVAEDVNKMLDKIGLKRINAIGFSFGGDVLFQLTLINPQLITAMISIGSVGSWTIADFPQLRESFTYENREQYKWLQEAQTSEEQVKILMDQFQNYTIYLTDEELQQIQSKVLIIYGDDDPGVDLFEIARVQKYLTHVDVWILPNVAHSAHTGPNKKVFISRTKAFLAKTK
ncbi:MULTISPECIES: alpha/beta fold hydrolase [Flavobacteriaceae]|uniref:alpha/beta fold hydrolase n=1 Tax=Flavobacteriaceae TaxID=49546 RepID=UPI00234BFA78|nr:alpha/beta hydrolase [Muricauda sp. SP22]MDC6363821.1 alpha/beta hydrolase [Muricauda sp. SP22]